MSNKKEQTTVEWYTHRLYEIEIAYNQGVIDTEVYAKSKTHALEQAKEMEKEQMIGLLQWMNQVNQSDPMRLETDDDDIVEQYYIETYGGNK